MGINPAIHAGARQAADPIGALVVVIAVDAGLIDADSRAGTFIIAQAAAALIIEALGLTRAIIIAQAVDAGALCGAPPVAVVIAHTLHAFGTLGVALSAGAVTRIHTADADAVGRVAPPVFTVIVAQASRTHAGHRIAALPRPAIAVTGALHAHHARRIAQSARSTVIAVDAFYARAGVGSASGIGAVTIGDAFHTGAPHGIAHAVSTWILPVARDAGTPRIADQFARALIVGCTLDAAALRDQALTALATIGIANALATQPIGLTGCRRLAVGIAGAARGAHHAGRIAHFVVCTSQLGTERPLGAALTDRQATAFDAFEIAITGVFATRRAEIAAGHRYAQIVLIAAVEVAIAARAGVCSPGAATAVLGTKLVGGARRRAAHNAITEGAFLVGAAIVVGDAATGWGRFGILTHAGLQVAHATGAITGHHASGTHIAFTGRALIKGRRRALARRASNQPDQPPKPPPHTDPIQNFGALYQEPPVRASDRTDLCGQSPWMKLPTSSIGPLAMATTPVDTSRSASTRNRNPRWATPMDT